MNILAFLKSKLLCKSSDVCLLVYHNQPFAALAMDLNTEAILEFFKILNAKFTLYFVLDVFNLFLRFAKYHYIVYVDDDAVLCAWSSKQYTRICNSFLKTLTLEMLGQLGSTVAPLVQCLL